MINTQPDSWIFLKFGTAVLLLAIAGAGFAHSGESKQGTQHSQSKKSGSDNLTTQGAAQTFTSPGDNTKSYSSNAKIKCPDYSDIYYEYESSWHERIVFNPENNPLPKENVAKLAPPNKAWARSVMKNPTKAGYQVLPTVKALPWKFIGQHDVEGRKVNVWVLALKSPGASYIFIDIFDIRIPDYGELYIYGDVRLERHQGELLHYYSVLSNGEKAEGRTRGDTVYLEYHGKVADTGPVDAPLFSEYIIYHMFEGI